MKRHIGVDLGIASSHKAIVVDENGRSHKPIAIEVSIEGYERLAELAFGGADRCRSEVVMEPTGNMWMPLAAFLNFRGVPVVVGTGKKVSDLCKFYRRHVKTDVIDAEAMARLPEVDPKGCHTFEMPTIELLSLRRLVKQRERFVRQTTACKVRIHTLLQLTNPALVDSLGEDTFSTVARVMFRHFADPLTVVNLGLKRFKQSLRRHGVRFGEEIVNRIFAACEKSSALYKDLRKCGSLPFDYQLLADEINAELEMIEFAEARIASIELAIETRYQRLDPAQTLRQIPGIGTTIAPAIEALSSPISRFRNAKAYAGYCGLIPRKSKSGKSDHQGLPITKASHRLLKKYYYLAAEISRRHDPELAAYYTARRAAGWHHERIVVAIAHALVRRVYALLRRREDAELSAVADAKPVGYEIRTPAGEILDRKAARVYVAEHYPSKQAQARLITQSVKDKRDASQLGNEGQPKGSTNRVVQDHVPTTTISQDAPQNQLIPRPMKTVDNPVEMMCKNDDKKN